MRFEQDRDQNRERQPRINGQIQAHTVRVTGADGAPLGIMPLRQALETAWGDDMDLVEVAAMARPPVCKIMDYGKFKFEENKKKKDQAAKNKPVQAKEVWMRPVSAEHDLQTKVGQIRKFLEEGRVVTVGVEFKKREIAYRDQGREVINRVVEALAEVGKPESPPKFEGRNFSVRLKPVKE